MEKKQYKGVIPALATPLHEDETIDEVGLARLLEYQITAGVGGVFVLGSMGEFAALEDKEKWRLVELTVKKVNKRVPVLAGASDTGTKRVIRNTLMVKSLGADAAVILPPYYYFLPAQEEIYKFYRDVAEKTEFPVVIYNNPTASKVELKLKTIARLSRLPHIIGIKDSSGNYLFVENLLREVKNDDFFVFQGDQRHLARACVAGADGLVPGLGTLIPHILVKLYEAASNGDMKETNLRQEQVLKLLSFRTDSLISTCKYGLKLLNLTEDYVCKPSPPLNDKTREKVKSVLLEFGYIKQLKKEIMNVNRKQMP